MSNFYNLEPDTVTIFSIFYSVLFLICFISRLNHSYDLIAESELNSRPRECQYGIAACMSS